MNSKAMLSIDVMLTILAVLLFVTMFQPVYDNFIDTNNEISARAQVKNIALDTMSRINLMGSHYYLDAADPPNPISQGAIEFYVPFIFLSDKPAGQDCSISIRGDSVNDTVTVSVSHDLEKKDGSTFQVTEGYTFSSPFAGDFQNSPIAQGCGEKIELTFGGP